MKQMLHITTRSACFGIVFQNGYAVKAAPMAAWAVRQNKRIADVKRYYQRKGAKVQTTELHDGSV